MPVSKLKNLVILILLLANLALLGLLIPSRIAAREQTDSLANALSELCESRDVSLSPDAVPDTMTLNAIPTTEEESRKELQILEGDIPSPVNPPKGCKFHTRCPYCTDICKQVVPAWEEVSPNHFVACHHKLHRAAEKKENG